MGFTRPIVHENVVGPQNGRAQSQKMQRTYQVGRSTLSIEFSDITTSKAEVLVSSDDSHLSMGGGVSASIRRAAGQGILIEVAKMESAKLGDVVVTSAGLLPVKYIFHAVTIGEGSAVAGEIVAKTTRRSLTLLREFGLSSIAFPAIGAGAAGFALEDVAAKMAEAMVGELSQTPDALSVTIYLFDRFGRMQPIDYIGFFEEFAARARGLHAAPAKRVSTPQPAVKRSRQQKEKDAASLTRVGTVAELAVLDRERQALEGRLAQYKGVLADLDERKLKAQLNDIQEKRINLLSKVVPRPSRAVSVFVSYSHVDEQLRKELGKHLSVLERQGIIKSWYDRMIGAGAELEGMIDVHLNEARVILLLISADFIASPYCYDVEMKRALVRHDERQALVVPIILRAVSLNGTPFAKLQALPKDARPVSTWADRDSAFVDITDGLRNAVQDIVGAA
jgi:O-acetyl-ADP-ribose deacetylase (regulator of RNase III)